MAATRPHPTVFFCRASFQDFDRHSPFLPQGRGAKRSGLGGGEGVGHEGRVDRRFILVRSQTDRTLRLEIASSPWELAMTGLRCCHCEQSEAISGGNMRSRRKLAMTNFVFFASFVVQNRVNRRIDASSAEVLICRSPVGADTEVRTEIRPYDGIIYFRCITKNRNRFASSR